VAQVDIPYQAGGLLSEVTVTLPSTPAAAGAAGANIYIQHRSGNVVLAYRIEVDTVDEITLTGAVADCYRAAPLVNSTGSTNAVDITGAEPAVGGDTPAFTRFYIRETGADWTAGDRRLNLAGVDEWDPATVTYPLVYTGLSTELVPGSPPTVSQVKAVRPIDLAAEVSGILAKEHLEASGVRVAEVEVTAHVPDWATALATPGEDDGELVLLVPLEEDETNRLPSLLYMWNTNRDTPQWELISPCLPSQEAPGGSDNGIIPGTMILHQQRYGGPYQLRVNHTGSVADSEMLPMKLWYKGGMGDYLGFLGCFDDLATLQEEEYEPWNSGYIVAFVIDTEAWYRYNPDTSASSTSDAGASQDISAGPDCKFKISVDGDAAEEVTLVLTGLTTASAIAAEMMKRINLLGGTKQYINVYWTGTNYAIYGDRRDGASVVITNGDTLNVADNLKIGVANGGVEVAGAGGWVKVPSSSNRGTYADVAALPSVADENDTAMVLDDGGTPGVPAFYRYASSAWSKVGNLVAP
jgi:hypothetical protein